MFLLVVTSIDNAACQPSIGLSFTRRVLIARSQEIDAVSALATHGGRSEMHTDWECFGESSDRLFIQTFYSHHTW